MSVMRAVAINVYGPAEALREMSLTVPEPADDEVLLRVHASSINPLDWKTRKGKGLPAKGGFPRVLGFDVSGVVERVGRGVTHLQPGDAVYGVLDPRRGGGNAEYVCTRAARVIAKPAALSHTEAAAVPVAGLTALQSLKLHAHMKAGERVLILGASGGVGHLAVQIARAYGAHVTATCGARNVEFVRGLGADAVIPYDTDEVPSEHQFDVIFDTVKAWDFAAACRRLTPTGRYVSTLPDVPGLLKVKLFKWFGFKQQCRFVMLRADPHGLKYLAELADKGQLRPHLQQIYPLDGAAEAHRVSEDGHVTGKLVVEVG
ncbi:MAG: NAD(P)-dependent alcohol dehydrogenase [Nitrospirota bacterium]|nr:NAD(P)-dependent alcohol dehydrogenase [Nitrospirota bacterium]